MGSTGDYDYDKVCSNPFKEHAMLKTTPGELELGKSFRNSLVPLVPGLLKIIKCLEESTHIFFLSRHDKAWRLVHENLFIQIGIQVSAFDIHLIHSQLLLAASTSTR